MEALEIQRIFGEKYGQHELLVRSPARVNLIGEHTDYNDGFVLPAAINKETYFALSKNGTNTCNIYAAQFDESLQFSLDNPSKDKRSWANYIIGTFDQLQKAGYKLSGVDCVFGGNVPIGAGLSSSASVVCGLLYSVARLFSLDISNIEMIKLGQKVENEFIGVQCGIMDQFINIMGRENHALRLDCRSLEFFYFPIELEDHCILLCNSRVSHSLATSAYNTRKKECLQGLEIVKRHYPHVESLRDVKLDMLRHLLPELGESVFNRCRFVIEENMRVIKSCAQLQSGDIKGFGENLYESHYGLALEYRVSCPELDFLIGNTIDKPYVLGARMMGGGFGGCTINIVEKQHRDTFIEVIKEAYHDRFSIETQIYDVQPVGGCSLMSAREHLDKVSL